MASAMPVCLFSGNVRGRMARAAKNGCRVNCASAMVACEKSPDCLAKSFFALDNRFTLADIAVGSLLGWLNVRMSEFRWREKYPNLAELQDRLETRPSFANTVPYAQLIHDKVV